MELESGLAVLRLEVDLSAQGVNRLPWLGFVMVSDGVDGLGSTVELDWWRVLVLKEIE